MQVTPEMIQAARGALAQVPLTDLEIGRMLAAALDAMPKATGGCVPGPGATSDLVPQPANVTPPQKVHDAADKLPGLTFNLNQQYGGVDEAAARKLLSLDVRSKPEPGADE